MPKYDFNKVATLKLQISNNKVANFNFIEIALRHGCSPVNLLHIFRKPFPKNTSGRLLLIITPTRPKVFVGICSKLLGLL